MIFTNAAAKRNFYLIQHFGVKMSPAPRYPRHQDSRVKLSCFAPLLCKSWSLNDDGMLSKCWFRDKQTSFEHIHFV